MNLTPKPRYPGEERPPLQKEEWRRMARHIHRIVMSHPSMQPLRDARERFHVFSSVAWVGIMAVREPGGSGFVIDERIEEPEWWKPFSRARGDQLAEELMRRVMERWKERSKR